MHFPAKNSLATSRKIQNDNINATSFPGLSERGWTSGSRFDRAESGSRWNEKVAGTNSSGHIGSGRMATSSETGNRQDTKRLESKKQTLDDAYAVPANFLEIDVVNPETHGVGKKRYTDYEVRMRVGLCKSSWTLANGMRLISIR